MVDDVIDFFIAIFIAIGIGCLIYALWSGRHSTPSETRDERFRRECREAIEERRRLVQQYGASDELLAQTKEVLFSCRGEAAELCKRIMDEVSTKKPSYDMIELALLAQKCKVPEYVAMYGFMSNGHLVRPENFVEERFLRWYDNELRSHGFPYKLKFVLWDDIPGTNMCADLSKAVDISDHLPTGRCCYFWEPQRFSLGGKALQVEPVYWLCQDDFTI